jgi:uncharacterized membrane protein
MDTSEFGFWAMIIFWGTALGGIATAITWARMKGRNPANRELLERSLRQRLERGEISREEFDRRMNAIDDKDQA